MKFNEKTFNPEAFGHYVERVPNLKRNELIRSRALRTSSEIKNLFGSQTGTVYATMPMYGLLGGEPLNYDGQTDIESESTVTFERGVVVVGRAKSWMEQDFSEDITGGADFMDNVVQQVASYWDEVDQKILLSILKGIYSMTGAKNLEFVEGHTYDISDREGEAGCIAPTSLNTAIQKACGDNKGKFTMVFCHSTVSTNLENLNLLSYLKYTDAQGIQRDLSIGTWNGRVVIVDDGMPVEHVDGAGETAGYDKYTTYLLGDGAFDYADIGVEVPTAMVRDEKTNGGQTTLYTRQRKCFAPYGISYLKKSQASSSPKDEELENGANWGLVNSGGTSKEYINHKAIPIARIISRG